MRLNEIKSITIHGVGFECETCGARHWNPDTKRCDECWDVEHRLADYLRRGGENALTFVIVAVADLPDEPQR